MTNTPTRPDRGREETASEEWPTGPTPNEADYEAARAVNEIIRDFAADGMDGEDLDATAVDVIARAIAAGKDAEAEKAIELMRTARAAMPVGSLESKGLVTSRMIDMRARIEARRELTQAMPLLDPADASIDCIDGTSMLERTDERRKRGKVESVSNDGRERVE